MAATPPVTAVATVPAYRAKHEVATLTKANLLPHWPPLAQRRQLLTGDEHRVVVERLEPHQNHACVLTTLSWSRITTTTAMSTPTGAITSLPPVLPGTTVAPGGVEHEEGAITLRLFQRFGVSAVDHVLTLRRLRRNLYG